MGMPTGELVQWTGPSITKRQQLFKTYVDAIEGCGTFVFTGDRLGNIVILNERLDKVHQLSLSTFKEQIKSMDIGLNAFSYDQQSQRLIIGTRGNEVYEFSCNIASKTFTFKDTITLGHFAP